MKHTVLLTMLLAILQLSFSQTTPANNKRSVLTASTASSSNDARSKPVIITKVIPSNVEFPAILKASTDESKEYVEKFSKKKRDYLIRTFTRGKKMFPKISATLKKYNLPTELKVLIALESAFNPNARSSSGAFGYWQFMDDVAREYGLTIISAKEAEEIKANSKVKSNKNSLAKAKPAKKDDRSNFVKSTNAAARYLSDRKRNLGDDWLLVVASYNWGVGNVWEAIRKTGKKNASFWDIKKYLPAETKAYVMNFIALNVIFNNYDKFLKNKLQFDDKVIETVESLVGPEDSESL